MNHRKFSSKGGKARAKKLSASEPNDIAGKLRSWRKRAQLSQSKAAVRIGVSMATLQNWEQGRNRPRGFTLRQLLTLIK